MAEERTAADLRPLEVRRGEAGAGEVARIGRYEVLFELARGGMGTVHAARLVGPRGFAHTVAIKRLIAAEASADEVAGLFDEARIAARLHHPNVVEIFELALHEGAPYIVMQLVSGVSLGRLLARAGDRGEALDPWLVAWIVGEIAAGLHAAHELREQGELLGLVHRDVSPENILISFDGAVRVSDFGVAKWRFAERATEDGVTRGKLAYMSPEQTGAGAIDRRSDVFALGVVAHEALAGRRLFVGESPAETIRRVLELEAPELRTLRPEVPEAVSELVRRCLEKDRAKRPGTADEVGGAMRALLRQERRVVDATDLAAVMARLFPGERERLAERIASAARAPDGDGGRARDADGERARERGETGKKREGERAGNGLGSGETHVSVSATALPLRPVVGSRARAIAVALVGAAALIGVGFLVARRAPEPSANAASAAAAEASRGSAASSASGLTTSGEPARGPVAEGEPEPARGSGSAAPPVASGSAVAVLPITPRKAVTLAPLATATALAGQTTTAAPAASARSSKGVPFKSLDQ